MVSRVNWLFSQSYSDDLGQPTRWCTLSKRDKSMIAYEVRIKLNSGDGVSCESEPPDKGK